MNSVLMIFIDGVGIGKEDYEFNPFFKYGFKTFTELFGQIPSLKNPFLKKENKFLFTTDARLGMEGLPQSGTGQTSIFCGMNAAKFVGKHFGPYPYSTLIPVIKEKNIFLHFLKKEQKIFFDYINSGRQRLSVTSLSCLLSGMKLNRVSDVRRGNALTAEITNERWNLKLNYNLSIIKPETSARRLLRIASKNKFTLYEYFLTDHIGHGRYDGELQSTIKTLDNFLYTIISEMDYKKLSLIICSDHGNFEDLSLKTHTLNPSLTITAGRNAEKLYKEIKSISQIRDAIIKHC